MNIPKFWYQKGIISFCLIPLSYVYLIALILKKLKISTVYKAHAKVICVGNITSGGAGKTPLCIEIAKILQKNTKAKVAFLSKGYKGNFSKTFLLNKELAKKISYKVTGDEPLLLCLTSDVLLCTNRIDGLKLADNLEIDYVILDDGAQDNSIRKDLNIMVVDGSKGFLNERLIPAGPLREPMSAIKKFDVAVMIGHDNKNLLHKINQYNTDVIKAKTNFDKTLNNVENYVAFAGIAYPDKFFNMLTNSGLNIIKSIGFEDHHVYSSNDFMKLISTAKELKAKLITTSKDFVKLPKKLKKVIIEMPISLSFYENSLSKYLNKL